MTQATLFYKILYGTDGVLLDEYLLTELELKRLLSETTEDEYVEIIGTVGLN